jgi:hypothetical protein
MTSTKPGRRVGPPVRQGAFAEAGAPVGVGQQWSDGFLQGLW